MAIASRRRTELVDAPSGSGRRGVSDAPGAEVDVALVLAIDGSGSISEDRLRMQIGGYLQALRHPGFIQAVRGGRFGRIASCFVQWSDVRRQDKVAGWSVIKDEASSHAFATEIANAMRPLPGWTSISGAIDFSVKLLKECGYVTGRRIIDISGDGSNNDGRPVTEARDEAVAAGVTINGLPILEAEPNLDTYYRDNVIGGPDFFVVVARDTGSFAEAILRKLLVEIAGLPPPGAA